MRTYSQLVDRIQMAIVEQLNANPQIFKEPENAVPVFIEKLTQQLTELVLDEVTYRR